MQIRVSDMLSSMSACNEKLEDQVTSMNSRLDILEQNVNRLPDLFSSVIQQQFKKYFEDPDECINDGGDCYESSCSATPPTPKKLPSLRSRQLRRNSSNLSADSQHQIYERAAAKNSPGSSKGSSVRRRDSSQRTGFEKVPSRESVVSEEGSQPSEKTRSTILYTPDEHKLKNYSNSKSQKQLL